jgi:putative MATE family efflux protein
VSAAPTHALEAGPFRTRQILELALPAAGSAALLLAHRAVDMAWVKTLGVEATAALSMSLISVWLFAGLGALVGTGLTALVARYAGAGRLDAAGYVAAQGLRWAPLLGVIAGLVGLVLAPWLYRAAGASEAAGAYGVAYTRVYWGGGALILLQLAADAVFRAHGNTRLPFLIGLLALVINVVLDPLFIHGGGPVPAMGVGGAALANVLSYGVGAWLSVLALRRRGFLRRARPSDTALRLTSDTPLGTPGLLGLDRSVFRRMARVGIPLFVSNALFNSIYLVLHALAARAGGSAAQAGLGIGHNGEGLAFVLGLGWATAAAALVGRSLGAGRPDEAERYAWSAARQCALLCAAWGLVLFLFDDALAGLWADGPAAQSHGAAYLRIVSFCLALQALEIVLDGAFGGAGMTIPPLVISGSLSLLRIPLAAIPVLHWGWGAASIWWVISITAGVRGLLCAWWFARGTWKTRSV